MIYPHAVLGLAATTLLGFSRSPAGHASCIWDSDTLGDEVRGLPDAFKLVTGRCFRHSRLYYEKRIRKLPRKLAIAPGDFGLYDDLAVAFERLGNHEKAIEVMGSKALALGLNENKEHRYRYHANLGTFLAHSGKFSEAVSELRKAIDINPSAHFGREIFQIELIRYVAQARKDKELWSAKNFMVHAGVGFEKKSWSSISASFSFSGKAPLPAEQKRTTTWTAAYTAVAGMLRFGGLEGPELYRALGDLFVVKGDLHLAWWSYKHAIERGHAAKEQIANALASIERHWRESNKSSGKRVQIPTQESYEKVRNNADAWLAAFRRFEDAALADGKDTGDPTMLQVLVAKADKAVPPSKVVSQKPGAVRPAASEKQQKRKRSSGHLKERGN